MIIKCKKYKRKKSDSYDVRVYFQDNMVFMPVNNQLR